MPLKFHLPRHCLLAVQKLKYYFGLSFAVAGAIVALWGFLVLIGKPGNWLQLDKIVALSRIITGSFAVILGSRLLLSVPRPSRQDSSTNSFNSNIGNGLSSIYTGGGNYNESISGTYIQGDFIAIEADYTGMSSDLSEATIQLREVVTRLEDRGFDLEDALQEVTKDLANQAKNNRAVRVKLRRWRESIGDAASDTSLFEAATTVIQAATVSNILLASLSLTGDTNYQRLERLLADGKWKEADRETASIILKPLLEEVDEYLISMYVDD